MINIIRFIGVVLLLVAGGFACSSSHALANDATVPQGDAAQADIAPPPAVAPDADVPDVRKQNISPLINNSSLPLPRFVSTKTDNTYVRTGPAVRYPVKWVLKRKNMPVEVVQEFDHWRKIRDFEGGEGWVHKTLITGERFALVTGNSGAKGDKDLVPMREGFSTDAKLVARLEPGVIARLLQCSGGWCRLEKDAYSGWVERKFLWGIYDHEDFD